MLNKVTTFKIKNYSFDLGVSVSTSFPQLWYIKKEDNKYYIPFGILFENYKKFKMLSLIIISIKFHIGWMK